MTDSVERPFSADLEAWLRTPGSKTVAQLNRIFGEKSLAIISLVLMIFPALPLPTGGISHVFEAISMVVAAQLMVGRHTIWLPRKWLELRIRGLDKPKTIKVILGVVRWTEHFTRRRFAGILYSSPGLFVAGFLLFAYSLAAFLAPPFSGLDTFPAIGAALVALALVAEDAVVFAIGAVAGVVGVAIMVGLGAVLITLLQELLHSGF